MSSSSHCIRSSLRPAWSVASACSAEEAASAAPLMVVLTGAAALQAAAAAWLWRAYEMASNALRPSCSAKAMISTAGDRCTDILINYPRRHQLHADSIFLIAFTSGCMHPTIASKSVSGLCYNRGCSHRSMVQSSHDTIVGAAITAFLHRTSDSSWSSCCSHACCSVIDRLISCGGSAIELGAMGSTWKQATLRPTPK